jgi:hypothetical protein
MRMGRKSAVCAASPLITSSWSIARCMWIVFDDITALESSASAEDTAASESSCRFCCSKAVRYDVRNDMND